MNMNKLLSLFLRGQHTNNTTSERIRVGRTLEGTVFELTFVVLLIIVWALLIYFLRQTPDIVPTHFGPSGEADAHGSKYIILVICIIMSLMGVGLMIGAYHPQKGTSLKIETPRQVLLVTRMLRLLGLMSPVLSFAIGWTSLASVRHGGPNVVPILIVVGIMVAISLIFPFLILRSKS